MVEIHLISLFISCVEESGIDEAPMTDELLLCFLNFRSEDKSRALKALKSYIGFKKNNPELMSNLQSTCPPLLETAVFHRVSPVRDQHGRYVYIAPMGNWRDDLCSWEEVFRVFINDLHIAIADVETQMNGAISIIDFKNFGIRKMRGLTPLLLKKFADIIQGKFPLKVKLINIINHSWLFSAILKMVWPFLSVKMRSRILLHDNYESLHKAVHPASLPSDYKGQLGPISEMKTVKEVIKPANYIFECLDKCSI